MPPRGLCPSERYLRSTRPMGYCYDGRLSMEPQQLIHDLVDVLENISDIYPTCMSEVNIC